MSDTAMATIAEFLLARLREREDAARACIGVNDLARGRNGEPIPRWVQDGARIVSGEGHDQTLRVRHTWAREATHIALNDPAFVLADCAAKRRVIRICQLYADEWGNYSAEIFREMAVPFASHPDYREEWKP